jgi:hypothetical protein
MDNLIEKEKKMNIDGHAKSSSVSHNRMKENSNAIGRKRMSDEKFGREMVEVKEHINMLMKLL